MSSLKTNVIRLRRFRIWCRCCFDPMFRQFSLFWVFGSWTNFCHSFKVNRRRGCFLTWCQILSMFLLKSKNKCKNNFLQAFFVFLTISERACLCHWPTAMLTQNIGGRNAVWPLRWCNTGAWPEKMLTAIINVFSLAFHWKWDSLAMSSSVFKGLGL